MRPRLKNPPLDKWGFPNPHYVPEPPRVPLKGPGSAKAGKIIEGLRSLARVQSTRQEKSFSCHEIAEACGCSDRYISQIEHRALKKMRAILGVEFEKLFA